MKSIIILSLLFLASGCFLSTSDSDVPNSTAVSVVGDITDKKKLWPSVAPILQLYNFTDHPSEEAWFSLTYISDKKINPRIAYHLPTEEEAEKSNTYDDPQFRKRNIKGFYNQINKAVDTFYKSVDTTKSLNYSECFAVIAMELTELSKLNADQKILLAFTDLLELSALDAYQEIDTATPKKIASLLLQHHTIPKVLEGIRMIVIYAPKTRVEDQKVVKMAEAYKYLIESRGGRFEIKANNYNY